ncbi:MAG: hypothetical protein M4579_004657 [Chaenotheca gracillima]|nr:MAG: hypothetical protein M4579_004657 [Chaenotheca gracillima]
MAAVDTPWIDSMSTPPRRQADNGQQSTASEDPNPPTVAAFSPVTLSHASAASKQRSTILVHQKSPLLVATPPQITRALAYSHPFLLPLNKLVGLVSWTSGDPWESFLLVVVYWAAILYGDVITRWAGPVVVAIWLIVGMYSRRFSPLSSAGWTGEKVKSNKKSEARTSARHQKSLDEIVETMKVFTTRCNLLLEPFLLLTDFLSTQTTATSATTRPALTRLFGRILMITPIWIALTLPPLHIVTTRRTFLTLGTLILSWHSRPARISRTILWRSKTVRRISTVVTGLDFGDPIPATKNADGKPPLPPRSQGAGSIPTPLSARRRPDAPGVRFTFILYQNQRRWLGLGWTSSLFAYERAAWTDEHLNPSSPKDHFELPDVEGGAARWRWVEGSEWRVEGAGPGEEGGSKDSKSGSKATGDGGWIYYDNKWHDPRRGQDSWGRYTRRRKWYRDAELVEVTSSTEITPSVTPSASKLPLQDEAKPSENPPEYSEVAKADGGAGVNNDDTASVASSKKRRWFRRNSRGSVAGTVASNRLSVDNESIASRDDEDDEQHPSIRLRPHEREGDWGVGDDASMGLS